MAEIFWSPVEYYLLEDGTWLICEQIPFTVGPSWFHAATLLPHVNGYSEKDKSLNPEQVNELMKTVLKKCHIGF